MNYLSWICKNEHYTASIQVHVSEPSPDEHDSDSPSVVPTDQYMSIHL